MMFRIAAKKLREEREDPTGLKFHTTTATTNNVDEAINFAVCLAPSGGTVSDKGGRPCGVGARPAHWESMKIGR